MSNLAVHIRSSYRFLGFTCHVLHDGTVAQVSSDGRTMRVTGDRRTVLGFHTELAEAIAASLEPAGPGKPGRPRAAWQR